MELNFMENFQWLLGVWKTRDGGSIYDEWWKKDEYTIEGPRYVRKHGEEEVQEKFRLVERGGNIYYSIIGSKTTSSAELKMNFLDERMAVFESLAKTFPKFIRYKLKLNDLLDVIADGLRKDGKSYRVQYPFAKVS